MRGLLVAGTILLLAAGAPARALEPIGLEGRMSILRDPGRGLSAIDAERRAADFAPAGDATPNLGLTSDALWLRFELRNTAAEREQVLGQDGVAQDLDGRGLEQRGKSLDVGDAGPAVLGGDAEEADFQGSADCISGLDSAASRWRSRRVRRLSELPISLHPSRSCKC